MKNAANKTNGANMSNQIKFGKAVKANNWSPAFHPVLVERDGQWISIGKMEANTDEFFTNDGSQRTLVRYYSTTVNGYFLSADVRIGSRYDGGTIVQSAASAKAALKVQIIEALES